MATLGARLREMTKLSKIESDHSLTTDEINWIIEQLHVDVLDPISIKRGVARFLFDTMTRAGNKKGFPVPRKPVPAIEEYFFKEGVKATFRDDPELGCSMCNLYDCDRNAHYGYILTWDEEEK